MRYFSFSQLKIEHVATEKRADKQTLSAQCFRCQPTILNISKTRQLPVGVIFVPWAMF